MRTWKKLGSLLTPLCVLAGCGGIVAGGGSETGFLACANDSACGPGRSCIDGRCVEAASSGGGAIVEPAVALAKAPLGSCASPIELSGDDMRWPAEWTPDLPGLAMSSGTPHDPPALVAKWTAPYEGFFEVTFRSDDMDTVVAGTSECGMFVGAAGGGFKKSTNNHNGYGVYVLAGEAHYVSIFHGTFDGEPTPERGHVVVTISK